MDLNDAIREARQDVRANGLSLAREARQIARRLTQMAEALEKDPEGTRVNELGELQRSGLDIDLRCARYYEKQRHLTILKRVQS